jgi:hypothetical protein
MLRNRKALLLILLMAGSATAQTSAPAPAGEDWGSQIVDWTSQAVTAYGGILLSDGMTVLAYLLALKLLWVMGNWGLDKGLSLVVSHHDVHPFPFSTILKIFGKAGFRQALQLALQLNDDDLTAGVYNNLGAAAQKRGELYCSNAAPHTLPGGSRGDSSHRSEQSAHIGVRFCRDKRHCSQHSIYPQPHQPLRERKFHCIFHRKFAHDRRPL